MGGQGVFCWDEHGDIDIQCMAERNDCRYRLCVDEVNISNVR